MHLGVILPNFGAGSSPAGIRRVVETAEQLGFDSVWATEHIIVGPEGHDPYGRVYEPLVTLGWIAGWHRDEFDFMGIPFEGRGRRADEALRVMRAIWSGASEFEGELWSFHGAMAEPLPSPPPAVWVGGSSPRALRRVLELGDAWHPSRGSDAGHVRRVKEEHPGLHVIPRTSPEHVDAMLEAGADGVVVTLADEAAMRGFARRYR